MWDPENFDQPEDVLKSTVRDTYSYAYLILLILAVFFVLLRLTAFLDAAAW